MIVRVETRAMPEASPSQEQLLTLHRALLAGDVTASVRLAELLLPALSGRFAGRRELDRAEVESIVGMTIATYLSQPERYDAARAPLLAYLYQDALGDIRNEAAKRVRRREDATDDDVLELVPARGNPTPEDDVVDRLDPLDLPRSLVDAAMAQVELLGDEDREFLRLRAEGVRSTHAYAAALGIAHLPPDQQRREVKRAKDRLDKRLGSIRARLAT
jgi:hypothetical protein